jgi:glycosyltransferase involved in cell wall biosynthesis
MTADSIGGVFTYALDLSRALGDLGVEVVLAVMGRPLNGTQHREAASVATLTVLEKPLKLEWMNDPWHDVEEARRWLLSLEREVSPDLIHLNGYAYAAAPFRAPRLIVAHSCVLSWWAAVKGGPAPHEWNAYRDQVARGLRAADSVVAPTYAMLEMLREHYELPARSEVIENGCDLARYAPDLKKPCLFSAGRLWDEGKNIAALARVAADLPWPLYVAGDAQRPIHLSEGAREDGMHALHALGALSRTDMADWLGRAAIYVHPAKYEPFGLSILEAAASGCALVLNDIPSLRELWSGAALFVQMGDSGALRRSLLHLIHDVEYREQLAVAAHARSRRYDLTRFRDAYVRHYESLCHAHVTGTRPVASGASSARGSSAK